MMSRKQLQQAFALVSFVSFFGSTIYGAIGAIDAANQQLTAGTPKAVPSVDSQAQAQAKGYERKEELDVSEELKISLIGHLGEIQWKALLPRIQARIVLGNDNQQAITQTGAENLPAYEINGLSKLFNIST